VVGQGHKKKNSTAASVPCATAFSGLSKKAEIDHTTKRMDWINKAKLKVTEGMHSDKQNNNSSGMRINGKEEGKKRVTSRNGE